MPTVELETSEWNQVIAILAQAPWNVANPLLNRVAEQLRVQNSATATAATATAANVPATAGELAGDRPGQDIFRGPGNRHG